MGHVTDQERMIIEREIAEQSLRILHGGSVRPQRQAVKPKRSCAGMKVRQNNK